MPRGPRVELPGTLQHVVSRSPSGRLFFRSQRDHEVYVRFFGEEVKERQWDVRTFCLMPNHDHFLLTTPDPDLSAGLKRIHERFATFVNREYGEHGAVFGSRYRNKPVLTEAHAVGCLRYIARNPVRAKLCSAAGEWPWSAHPALSGRVAPPPFLVVERSLALFEGDLEAQQAAYVRLVAKTDAELLADLERPDSDDWIMVAREDFDIPVEEIADFLKVGWRTVYRRMDAARDKKGSDPFLSDSEGG